MSRHSPWFATVLSEYSRSTVITVSAILAVLSALSIIQFMKGGSFAWNDIAPIDQPDIMGRAVYSALTFISLGSILYQLRFYQALSWLFGSNRSDYRQVKRFIWIGLMLIMYQYIVPFVVDLLNAMVSIFYNILMLALYLSPALFMGGVAVLLVFARTTPRQLKLRIQSNLLKSAPRMFSNLKQYNSYGYSSKGAEEYDK